MGCRQVTDAGFDSNSSSHPTVWIFVFVAAFLDLKIIVKNLGR